MDKRATQFPIIHHISRFTLYILCLLIILLGLTAPLAGSDESDSTPPSPYLIRQVSFDGNKHLERKVLSKTFGIEAGQPYERAAVVTALNRIIAEYGKKGFVFASLAPEIIPISSDQVHIKIRVNEGVQIRTGKITTHGNRLLSTSVLQRELGLREGKPFNQVAFEQGIERILRLYSEQGHPKVEVEPTDFHLSPEDGKIALHLQINEGNLIRIGEIRLSGLKKTKTETVLRELPIETGEVFDQRKIDQSLHRLVNLGYFYEVSPAPLEPGRTPDELTFHAKVTEARTGRFNGILGYAPPTSELDNAPRLTGLIEATENNLLGTGRRANLSWKSGLLSTLRVGYEEPWVFGKPVRIGVEYAQVKQQNQFTNVESKEQTASLKLSSRFRHLFEGALTVAYKQINLPAANALISPPPDPRNPFSRSEPPPTQPRLNPSFGEQAQSGSKYGLTFSLTRDSRDYFLNPTRGRRDHVAFEFSRGDFKLRKLWLDFQQYFSTWRKQVIAIGLHAAATWGDNIPPTELFYLGGANTLRGYDEDWFSGPRRTYANIEYRLLVGRTSQIFAFVDLGAVTKVDAPTTFDPLRVGYGLGIRLESKGGILSMDYGLAKGSSPLQGKLHVNLGTSF